MKAAPRVGVLDELRGFAALYVACAHVLLHNLKLESFWSRLPWLFGQELVMMFFLISGAAIRLSAMHRPVEGSWVFLQRRFLRLFPMIVLGLAAGYAATSIEMGEWRPLRASELLGNLLFLQDYSPVKPGTICNTYYGNDMLWSLSYEWWFYVMFFVVTSKIPKAWRTHAAGLVSVAGAVGLAVWPNAPSYWAAYFIVWWSGGSLVDPDQRERRRALAWMLATTGGFALVAAHAGGFSAAPWRPGVYPLLVVRHLGVTTALFALLTAAGPALRVFAKKHLRGFAWAAPMSYALYVVHYPLASDARWLVRTGLSAGAASALIYGGVALGAAWLAERYYEPRARALLLRLPLFRGAA
jgi:peptidoglycan/LPS O-acetylase OafA/YrhL